MRIQIIKGKNRIAALTPNTQTLSLFLRVPKVRKPEQQNITQAKIEQKISCSLENHYWDYLTLKEYPHELEILACLIRRKVVDELTSSQAKNIDALIPAAVALHQAYNKNQQDGLWIDFSEKTAHMALCQDGAFFYRECPNHIDQIIKTRDHFIHKHSIAPPTKAFVFGQLSESQTLELKSALALPLEFLKLSPIKFGIESILNSKSPPPINLMPKKNQEQRKFHHQRPYYLSAAALIILSTLGILYTLNIQENNLNHLIQEEDTKIAPIKETLSTIQTNLEQTASARFILQELQNGDQWTARLDFLNKKTSAIEGLWLDEIKTVTTSIEKTPMPNINLWEKSFHKMPVEAKQPPSAIKLAGYIVNTLYPNDLKNENSLKKLKSFFKELQNTQFFQETEEMQLDTQDPRITHFQVTLKLPDENSKP